MNGSNPLITSSADWEIVTDPALLQIIEEEDTENVIDHNSTVYAFNITAKGNTLLQDLIVSTIADVKSNTPGVQFDKDFLAMDMENSAERGSHFAPIIESLVDSVRLGEEFNQEGKGRPAVLAYHRIFIHTKNEDKLIITGKMQLISGKVISDSSIIDGKAQPAKPQSTNNTLTHSG